MLLTETYEVLSSTSLRVVVTVGLGLVVGCTDGVSTMVAKARAGDRAPLCHALCERVSTCEIAEEFEGVPVCTSDCAESPDLWSDACNEASLALFACELRLSCGDLGSLVGADAPGRVCEAEYRASQECQPPSEDFIYFQF